MIEKKIEEIMKKLKASLWTIFFQEIFLFQREISSFSYGKIEILWQNLVPKLALKALFGLKG
jgi:hypothetical protein